MAGAHLHNPLLDLLADLHGRYSAEKVGIDVAREGATVAVGLLEVVQVHRSGLQPVDRIHALAE